MSQVLPSWISCVEARNRFPNRANVIISPLPADQQLGAIIQNRQSNWRHNTCQKEGDIPLQNYRNYVVAHKHNWIEIGPSLLTWKTEEDHFHFNCTLRTPSNQHNVLCLPGKSPRANRLSFPCKARRAGDLYQS